MKSASVLFSVAISTGLWYGDPRHVRTALYSPARYLGAKHDRAHPVKMAHSVEIAVAVPSSRSGLFSSAVSNRSPPKIPSRVFPSGASAHPARTTLRKICTTAARPFIAWLNVPAVGIVLTPPSSWYTLCHAYPTSFALSSSSVASWGAVVAIRTTAPWPCWKYSPSTSAVARPPTADAHCATASGRCVQPRWYSTKELHRLSSRVRLASHTSYSMCSASAASSRPSCPSSPAPGRSSASVTPSTSFSTTLHVSAPSPSRAAFR